MQAITLIGMPGSGKSAVGIILAAWLDWDFVDTDSRIERREEEALQAVIDRLGEPAFLRLEEETVLGLTLDEPAVISTGGSVIYSEAAMQHLRRTSTVVFLDAPLDEVRRHISAELPRGIIGLGCGDLEELLRVRLPLYRRYAHVAVPLGQESQEEAASKVLEALTEYSQNN